MKWFYQGMLQTDELFVKEAVARLTVETAKQMWPQLWSSFINDMAELYKIGVCVLKRAVYLGEGVLPKWMVSLKKGTRPHHWEFSTLS